MISSLWSLALLIVSCLQAVTMVKAAEGSFLRRSLEELQFPSQTALGTGYVLKYGRNDTHAKIKVEYSGNAWVAIGLGSAMPGSTVLIGLNPAVNPGKPAVGLFDLPDYEGIPVPVPGSLTSFGIIDSSYTVAGGLSTLSWTVLIASQKAKFTFVNAPGTKANIVWSHGSQAAFSKHINQGVKTQFEVFVDGQGGVGGEDPTPAPDVPGGTVSADPEFAFESTLGNVGIVQYKQNDTHVAFKVKMNNAGYAGFGPGSQMLQSTVLIGMDPAANPGQAAVGLYRLGAKAGGAAQVNTIIAAGPEALLDFGVSGTSFVSAGGSTELRFTVEIAKQKPEFTVVRNNANYDGIFAAGGNTYSLHSAFGFLSDINFATGLSGGVVGTPLDAKLAAHIATMIAAWEIFSPVGVVIPLLNNAKHGMPAVFGMSGPQWLKYHWVLLTIGVFFGFIGTLTGYLYVDGNAATHWASNHTSLGLAILILSILQPLWGGLRPAKAKTGQAKTFMRSFFENGHPLLGYIIVLAGTSNCFIGVQELQQKLAGGDYVFNGMQGKTGFEGPMGVIVVILGAAFFFVLAGGMYRDCVNSSNKPRASMSKELLAVSDMKEAAGGHRIAKKDLQAHATESNCWVVYKNRVYNVTDFLASHPGGKKAILPYVGKDISEAFDNNGHSMDAVALMQKFYIGDLEGGGQNERPSQLYASSLSSSSYSNAPPPPPVQEYKTVSSMPSDPNKFLNGDNSVRRTVFVKEKSMISHNVYMIKFALPSPTMVLNLPVGKHISLFAPNVTGRVPGLWNNRPDPENGRAEIQRKYTPVSCDEKDKGSFSIVTKCYRPNERFPDGGKMGRFLESLEVGSKVDIAGPFGVHQYMGKGRFVDSGREMKVSQIGMVAGGSGITPIYQIARAMLMDPNDPCKISIVYANSSIQDILLKYELDELERKYPNRVRIWYTISQPPNGAPWSYSIGRVSKEMLQKRFPPSSKESIVITCGPQPMMETVAMALTQMGFPESQRIEY